MPSETGLLGPLEVKAISEALGIRPTKVLGQNFVHDAGTVRKIVAAGGVEEGDEVVEVGPGLGSLTLALLEVGARVRAVEKSGSSQALEMNAVTPTWRARSSWSSRLSATPSRRGISPTWVGRCVWLSTTGAARGAGVSGQGRGLRGLMRGS